MLRNLITLSVLVVAGLLSLQSAAAQPLVVLYSRAIERDETYLAAQTEVQRQIAQSKLTKSRQWPVISAQLESQGFILPKIGGQDYNANDQFDVPQRQSSIGMRNVGRLQLSHTLYQFGRLDAQVQQDTFQVQQSILALAAIQHRIQEQIALAYVDARAAHSFAALRQSQSESLQGRVRDVGIRVAEGFMDRNDLMAIQALASQSHIANIRAARQADLTQLELERVTYRRHVDILPAEIAALERQLPDTLDQAVLFAVNNAVEVLAARMAVRAAQQGIVVADRQYAPSLAVNASQAVGRNDTRLFAPTAQLGENDGYDWQLANDSQVGFTVSIPMFAGGARQASNQVAQADLQLALRNLNSTVERIDADIRQLWGQLEAQRAAYQRWHQLLHLEQRRLDAAEKMLAEGFMARDDYAASAERLTDVQAEIVSTSAQMHRIRVQILSRLGAIS